MKQQTTIMVVDDSLLNLSLMEAMLASAGYGVTLCESGDACMEAVRKNVPDIILVDVMLPDWKGFQVLRQLRGDSSTLMIPVIMVTSSMDLTERVDAINAGADDFLTKPVTRIDLLARVRALLKVKACNDRVIESEQRYRELVQSANVIIFATDSEDKITFMNEYGLDFFGYAAGEIVGRTEIETILPEYESTGRNLKINADNIKTNIDLYRRYNHENITKMGRRVWVDWTNRCVVDKQTGDMGLLSVGIDVTDTKELKQII
jgi:PAS domain S-box-containing protein